MKCETCGNESATSIKIKLQGVDANGKPVRDNKDAVDFVRTETCDKCGG